MTRNYHHMGDQSLLVEVMKRLNRENLWQGDLAQATGYSRRTINRVICGAMPLSYELARRLIKWLESFEADEVAAS